VPVPLRSVLVLIDGRTVYTPLSQAVYWQVQDTLLENIERSKSSEARSGTIWGANAVNAVINIITRLQRYPWNARICRGEISTKACPISGTGREGQSFNYRMYEGLHPGPRVPSRSKTFDDWRMGQAGFRSDWDLNDRDSFTLQVTIYNGDADRA